MIQQLFCASNIVTHHDSPLRITRESARHPRPVVLHVDACKRPRHMQTLSYHTQVFYEAARQHRNLKLQAGNCQVGFQALWTLSIIV